MSKTNKMGFFKKEAIINLIIVLIPIIIIMFLITPKYFKLDKELTLLLKQAQVKKTSKEALKELHQDAKMIDNSPKSREYVGTEFSSNWFMEYYLNPQPDKIPAALNFYCNSPWYDKSSSRLPMAHFFSILFKKDNKLMEKVFHHVSTSGSENEKIFTIYTLWATNSTHSHKLVTEAKKQWKTQAIQEIIGKMEGKLPPDILNNPIKETVSLDILWSMFFATGNRDYIKKIISTLHLLKARQGVKETLLGSAAAWSLQSNALQHQRVYDICKEELKLSNENTKKAVEEVLKQVNKKKLEAQKNSE